MLTTVYRRTLGHPLLPSKYYGLNPYSAVFDSVAFHHP